MTTHRAPTSLVDLGRGKKGTNFSEEGKKNQTT